jgi:uncharacterized protein (TIGR02145 family)
MALLNEQSAASAGLAFGERFNLGEPDEGGPLPWDFYVHYGVYDFESDGLIMGQLFHPFYNVVLLPDSLDVQDLSHEDFDEYIVAQVGTQETFTIAVRANEKLAIEGVPSAFEDDFVLQWIPLLSGDESLGYNEVAPDESGPCQGELTVNYHGYDYELVEIGDQCWFAENCRYLPEVSLASEYSAAEPRAYVMNFDGQDLDSARNQMAFRAHGVLYNFKALVEWPVCPSGYHVATSSDWGELESYVSSIDVPSAIYAQEANYAGLGISFAGKKGFNGFEDEGHLVKYWLGDWETGFPDNYPAIRFNHDSWFSPSFDLNGYAYSLRCIKDQ